MKRAAIFVATAAGVFAAGWEINVASTRALATVAAAAVVLELALLVGVVLLGRRFWRQVEPQVRPLIAMFAPPPASVTGPEPPPLPPPGP